MIVGIDPGGNGAVAILDSKGNLTSVVDMPMYEEKIEKRVKAKSGTKNEKDKLVKTVKKIQKKMHLEHKELFKIIPTCDNIALEKVSAMPGQGAVAMFTFGKLYGAIKAVSDIKAETVYDIRPTEWQKHFNLTKSKADKEGKTKSDLVKQHKIDIANKVLELYPEAELYTKRGALKDGRADAILIARYLFETQQK